MNKPILIAVHGLPGVGKDTIANFLTADGGKWSKVSFAGALKQGLSAMLNIPMEDIENPNIKNEPNYKFGKSIRYMAQTLGTEWGRNLIHPDIWIELAKEKVLHQFSMGQSVIITDLRFHNEVDAVKSLGGHIIHLIRDVNIFDKKAAVNGVSNHVSDSTIPFDEIDFTVNNNKGIKELELEVSKIIQRII